MDFYVYAGGFRSFMHFVDFDFLGKPHFYLLGASDARVIAIIVCLCVCVCLCVSVCVFLTPKFVGGRPPFPPEICAKSDPPPFKQHNFDQYLLIAPQP